MDSDRPTDPDSLHAMAAAVHRIDERSEKTLKWALESHQLSLRAVAIAERAVKIAEASPSHRLMLGYRYAMSMAVLALILAGSAILVACGVVQVR